MLTDRAGAARRTGQGNLIPGGLECVPGFSQLGKPYASRSATELGGGGHDEEDFLRRGHVGGREETSGRYKSTVLQ